MRTLLILRHGKSSWANRALDDFDRPLNDRGRAAVPLITSYLSRQGLVPDLVLCSAARRTRETWDLLSQTLDPPPEIAFDRGLYLASAVRLLQAAQRAPEAAGRLMIIGHNPGMEHFAAQLAGPESLGPPLEALQAKFPTAALAVVTSEANSWRDLAFGQARLIDFVKPRDLA